MSATETGTDATNRASQNRRMTADWFRAPPTDYLNVSSVVYPRGSRATVAELDENNLQVDVFYWQTRGKAFFRKGRPKDECVIELYVDSDDVKDASADSTNYAAFGIEKSKALIDALRPALASVHCPLPESVVDEYQFQAPFHDLYFAQGRILETLKHAGLGNVKEKQLRTFVTVMQVVLKKLNHTVRDLAGRRVIDFKHLWTLFPIGSFAVNEIRDHPCICQVIGNSAELMTPDPNSRKKEATYRPFRFAHYQFDGYNFGSHEDLYLFYSFEGHRSVSTLGYRPLKYEERFGDNGIVKKAVERGRKTLDYQTYHHCKYSGKCYILESDVDSRKIQVEDRVVVDSVQAWRQKRFEFFEHREYTVAPVPAKRQEIYSTMRSLFLTTQARRPSIEEQERRKQFFGAYDELLMLIRPILPAWSLRLNDWFWVDVSKLEPVKFMQDPMSRLVGSKSKKLGLLNMLIDRQLHLMPVEDAKEVEVNDSQRSPLVVLFTGPPGTGKTATVTAIAEMHQRPLIRIGVPRAASQADVVKSNFEHMLENSKAWKALILLDDAEFVLGLHKSELFYDQLHVAADHAGLIERTPGVFFMTKRDDVPLIGTIMKQVQAYIKFDSFTAEKREKIWRSLLLPKCPDLSIDSAAVVEGDQSPALASAPKKTIGEAQALSVTEEEVQKMSEWELNGHEIEHLYQNMRLLYPSRSGESIKAVDVEALKDLTICPAKEWDRQLFVSGEEER